MKHTKEELEKIVKSTNNCYDFLERLEKSLSPGNFTYWKNKVKSLGIDISHWQIYQSNIPKKNHDEILVQNSQLKFRVVGKTLKHHLLKINRKYQCENCGLDQWNNKPISLHIDHINGDWRDNRPENLRFLCPNCHSQTDSYCGKKNKTDDNTCQCGKKIQKQSKSCKECHISDVKINGRPNLRKHKINYCQCGLKIGHLNKLCNKCYLSQFNNKTKRHQTITIIEKLPKISKIELEQLIWEQPTTHIAKQYNVSDKAVEKWCKKYGISKPPRGYWTKKKNETKH